MDHIRNNHQDTCFKYLEGKCTFGRRCGYKHTNTIAQNVERNHSEPSHINSEEDFPSLPTRENRLVGIESATKQVMKDMNYMVNKIALFITRMEQMENMTLTKNL